MNEEDGALAELRGHLWGSDSKNAEFDAEQTGALPTAADRAEAAGRTA